MTPEYWAESAKRASMLSGSSALLPRALPGENASYAALADVDLAVLGDTQARLGMLPQPGLRLPSFRLY